MPSADHVRQAIRSLRRQPSLVALVLITLAIGLGATTAVFSVANTLIWRDLPYGDPHRLVSLNDRRGGEGTVNVALPNLWDWQAGAPALDGVGAWASADVNLAGPSGAERVSGGRMTRDLFRVLGAPLIQGRTFTEAEAAPGTRVAIVTESAWRQFLSGRDDVLARTITIDGETHQVIGVAPDIPGIEARVWRPVIDAGPATSRRNHAYRAVGRLREDATIDQLRGQLAVVSARLEAAYPDTNSGWSAVVTPLQEAMTEGVTSVIALLAAAVGALLLLAAANTANLLGARATARQREFAVRSALGASRAQLLQQVLTESVLLGSIGCALGLGVAYLGTSLATSVIPLDMSPLWATPRVDVSTLAFSVGLAMVVSVACGVWPALVASRQRPQNALQERAAASPHGPRRTRATLAVVQVALASVLLVGTGLLLGSLRSALLSDPGFDASNSLTFRVTPPRAAYADAPALADYFDSLLTRLRGLPGVAAGGAVSGIPLGGGNTVRGVIRLGDPRPAPGEERLTLFQVSTAGYLPALGARLRGRDFSSIDTAQGEPVAIINQSLADALWPGEDAIGKHIHIFTDEETPRTVIGVVATIRHIGLDADPSHQYFVPMSQAPQRSMSVVLRTTDGFNLAQVRETALAIDPTLPLYDVRTLDQVMSQSLAERRLMAAVVSTCGAIALMLATIGVYGVVSHSVSERRREIGIRMALGASRGTVVGLVLKQALGLTLVGLVVGMAVSAVGTGIVSEFVFGVTPLDITTRLLVTLLIAVTTVVASLAPARTAAGIDPGVSLKGPS